MHLTFLDVGPSVVHSAEDVCSRNLEVVQRRLQQISDHRGRVVLLLALHHVQADEAAPEVVVQRGGKRAVVGLAIASSPRIRLKAGSHTTRWTGPIIQGQRGEEALDEPLAFGKHRIHVLLDCPGRRQFVLGADGPDEVPKAEVADEVEGSEAAEQEACKVLVPALEGIPPPVLVVMELGLHLLRPRRQG